MLRFKKPASSSAQNGVAPSQTATSGTRRTVNVGMGQVSVGGAETEMSIAGLGSCIGVAIWSPEKKLGALCHVVLPSSKGAPPSAATPAKFADWAVPKALEALESQGAQRELLVAKIAGGAHPLAAASPASDVGKQSAESLEALLTEAGVSITGTSVGGTVGRAVKFSPETGAMEVRQMSGATETL